MMSRIKFSEVVERFDSHPESYAKSYYGGEAAGAVAYTPIGEMAEAHPKIQRYIWDPLIHKSDLEPDHSGMLIVVYEREAKDE